MSNTNIYRPSSAPWAADVEALHEDIAGLQHVVGGLAKYSVDESEANAELAKAFRGALALIGEALDDLDERVKKLEKGRSKIRPRWGRR